MFSDNKSAISGPDANLSNEKFNHDIIHSDNHVHTYFSTDSDAPMEEMLKTAIDKGFTSLSLIHISEPTRHGEIWLCGVGW